MPIIQSAPIGPSSASLKLGDLELMTAPFTAQVGSSWGAWSSITSETSSLFLDGAVVTGDATGNREIRLAVRVDGKPRSGLIAACEQLVAEANKPSNTLTFTPKGGVPVVYDVFRVQGPERTDDESEAWEYREYLLTFPALPFARSAVRETPSGSAPGVTISDFEGTFTGLALATYLLDSFGSTLVLPTTSQSDATDFVRNTPLEADTNCTVTESQVTITSATGSAYVESLYHLAATAAGDVIARSTATWPVTGDVVSVCAGFKAEAFDQVVGVEFLDASAGSLGTAWGVPSRSPNLDQGSTYSAWAVARVPSGAASYRMRVKVVGCAAGSSHDVDASGMAGTQSTIGDADRRVQNTPFQGSQGMYAPPQVANTALTSQQGQAAAFIHGVLSAAVDISAQAVVGFYYKAIYGSGFLGTNGRYISLRLYDSTGKWSRWNLAYPDAIPNGTWIRLTQDLAAAPSATSPGGAANLADITAFSIDQNMISGSVDSLEASPAPDSTMSTPRGTVFNLSPILGSARSVAQVGISSTTAMTDFLVYSAVDEAPCMLAVTSNLATAPAPAGYAGVYSILGCLAPAVSLTNPQCTVTQKINGTTVATKTLTGTAQAGNHYVDFGSIALPLVAVPGDNLHVSVEFSLSPSSASWTEVLVLDVDASLVWMPSLATAMGHAWVDEPDALVGLGNVWVGTAVDRSDARALTSPPVMSRPLQVKAPSSRLLVYSTVGAPDVALSYYPRWLVEPS